jgi:hypothetical protein
MEIYEVRIQGTRPLLMHNPETISNMPRLRRGEHLDPKVEAEMGLYKDGNGTIGLPAYIIKACVREAGRNYRVIGRKATFAAMIRAGIRIEPDFVPISPQDWKVDVRPVVVQRQRILRARPRFDEWTLSFRIVNLDPTVIHQDILERILKDAGKWYGLGDFRPEFGLFEVEKFEKVEGI